MQFVEKELKETADVSRSETTLGDIARSLIALAALAIALYWLLGISAGFIAQRVPPTFETKLGRWVQLPFEVAERESERQRAEQILEKLLDAGEVRPLDYRVSIVELDLPNAFALPGGTIGITTGLLDDLESEEELAMVLGHEIGHFQQRDHLHRLGRSLLIGLGLTIIGQEQLSRLLTPMIQLSENRYSRAQESGADRVGLERLVEINGHAGGATDFFDRLAEGAYPTGSGYLASHPLPEKRSEVLRELIAERSYPVFEKTEW